MWPNPEETTVLVTFTEEILNGNLISCTVSVSQIRLPFFRKLPSKLNVKAVQISAVLT